MPSFVPARRRRSRLEGVGGALQWKVNGAAGGQTSTGTVTASGIFTAPPTVPSRQVATITGETSQQAAGASVDVLDKTTLVGGLRVVQSVAYLESLSKLYAAEFTALGSFTGLLPETAAVENGNSQISEVAAGGAKTTVATWSGENIAKLLSFHAVDGREYLLASGQIGGRIIRFDPVTRQSRDVVTGLNEPSALVFDPPTGDLLVAEKDKVTTVARSVIEAGLSPAAAAPGDREDPTYAAPGRRDALPASIPASGAAGVAVNRCARRLYFTLPADGLLVEYDPATGKLRTVLSGLRNPGALLGVYRKGSSCPNGFHLLLSERGLDRTLLVFPRDGTFVEWLSFTGIRDFLFLPRGNPFTPREGILVGENAGSVGSLALVRVSDLYDSSPPNPPDLEETGGEPKADVAVTGSAQPEPVAVGATLTYTITVINKGPAAASSITLTDRLPGALAFVSATSPQGTCANVRGTVECSLGSLGLNRQAVVTLRVTVNGRPADGVVTSTVAVTAREIDPDVSNNTTSARTTVLSATGTTLQVTTAAAVLDRRRGEHADGHGAGRFGRRAHELPREREVHVDRRERDAASQLYVHGGRCRHPHVRRGHAPDRGEPGADRDRHDLRVGDGKPDRERWRGRCELVSDHAAVFGRRWGERDRYGDGRGPLGQRGDRLHGNRALHVERPGRRPSRRLRFHVERRRRPHLPEWSDPEDRRYPEHQGERHGGRLPGRNPDGDGNRSPGRQPLKSFTSYQ
ncbi:MAG: hypothetical protein DMG07_01780 [Acidobacteria bacterium]|nr:MAG: hypothetical protein DMG07_01780 [Acidobacteriota bacterium]